MIRFEYPPKMRAAIERLEGSAKAALLQGYIQAKQRVPQGDPDRAARLSAVDARYARGLAALGEAAASIRAWLGCVDTELKQAGVGPRTRARVLASEHLRLAQGLELSAGDVLRQDDAIRQASERRAAEQARQAAERVAYQVQLAATKRERETQACRVHEMQIARQRAELAILRNTMADHKQPAAEAQAAPAPARTAAAQLFRRLVVEQNETLAQTEDDIGEAVAQRARIPGVIPEELVRFERDLRKERERFLKDLWKANREESLDRKDGDHELGTQAS